MRALVLIVAPLAAAACGDNAGPPFLPLQSGSALLSIEDGALVLSRDGMEKTRLAPGAFQIGTVDDLDSGASFDPYWLWVDNPPEEPEGLAWHSASSLRVIRSDSQGFELALDDDVGHVVVQPTTPGSFKLVFSSAHARVAFLRVQPSVADGERFYGLGEWGDAVEHRGKLRPMQLEVDTASESATNEAHVPVPLAISTNAWGVFAESKRPGAFDVARMDPATLDIAFGTADESAKGLALHLFTADAPLGILQPYYEATGYPGLPGYWTYGPLLWRDETTGQVQTLDDIQQIRTLDLATSGIWFDRPYSSGVSTFDWDPAKFSAPGTMLQALHDAGLRYAIWHTPYTAPGTVDDPAPDENAYATSHHFFPPTTGIQANPWSKPIDFTNPEAYAWWQQNLRKYTDPLANGGWGVEGFKLDYAEDVVLGALGQRVPWLFADGSDERTMHYGYTMLYHRIYRDVLDADNGLLLTRTGRWGDQTQGMIVWPGDLQADLSKFGDPKPGSSQKSVGGLPTALAFGIGLSASGFPFYASDTGGYRSSPPNNETWLRWVEANAVWSAMQVGDSSSQMPWEFTTANGRSTASLDTYRIYARLHMRLFPYVWTLAQQIRATGYPIVRPLGLAYAGMPEHPADQYFVGDALLVAPVITAGATSRMVWFPRGTWIDWFTGDEIEVAAVDHRSVAAALDQLPLYIKRGSIVPMLRDTIDTLAPATVSGIDSYANNPGELFVRIAAGPHSSFTLYDETNIEQELSQGTGSAEIDYTAGKTFAPGATFELIAWSTAPTSVTIDSGPLTQRASLAALNASTDGWFFDGAATGGTLWIKVAGTTKIATH
ncbi:MAG TPA: TIM-barrel domain-containing protein [Kofleriaceae bacterium]|nr:TIM-barrel domain-containing protein [Kofleriaceae bacterium]